MAVAIPAYYSMLKVIFPSPSFLTCYYHPAFAIDLLPSWVLCSLILRGTEFCVYPIRRFSNATALAKKSFHEVDGSCKKQIYPGSVIVILSEQVALRQYISLPANMEIKPRPEARNEAIYLI